MRFGLKANIAWNSPFRNVRPRWTKSIEATGNSDRCHWKNVQFTMKGLKRDSFDNLALRQMQCTVSRSGPRIENFTIVKLDFLRVFVVLKSISMAFLWGWCLNQGSEVLHPCSAWICKQCEFSSRRIVAFAESKGLTLEQFRRLQNGSLWPGQSSYIKFLTGQVEPSVTWDPSREGTLYLFLPSPTTTRWNRIFAWEDIHWYHWFILRSLGYFFATISSVLSHLLQV